MAVEMGRAKFKNAVEILVDEKDRIKGRLLTAYASQLSLINAKEDLPGDVLSDFYELRNALSDAEMPYGSGERAAQKLRDMDEEAASLLAKKIFSIFLKLDKSD